MTSVLLSGALFVLLAGLGGLLRIALAGSIGGQ